MCRRSDTPRHSRVIVSLFAVPVGVPIAEVAPAYYSMHGLANQPRTASIQSDEELLDRLAEKLAAKLIESRPVRQVQPQALAESDAKALFQQKCVRCHSGQNAKEGLDLSGEIEQLDRRVRQDSVLRMLERDPNKRMPKGGAPLKANEFQTLFRALVL